MERYIKWLRLILFSAFYLCFSAPPLDKALVDNNRKYNWYRTQHNTGELSNVNCGPTSIHMAMKYQDNNPDAAPSAAEIRQWRTKSAQNNGNWYWNIDISEVLQHYAYQYEQYELKGKNRQDVKKAIREYLLSGHVAIVCLNVSTLKRSMEPEKERYNRFYNNVTGHFILLKGILADEEWYIVYDPWVMNRASYYEGDYPAGLPMGKDRYYNSNEIINSVISWNKSDRNYAFTVLPQKSATHITFPAFQTDTPKRFARLTKPLFQFLEQGSFRVSIFRLDGRLIYSSRGPFEDNWEALKARLKGTQGYINIQSGEEKYSIRLTP